MNEKTIYILAGAAVLYFLWKQQQKAKVVSAGSTSLNLEKPLRVS